MQQHIKKSIAEAQKREIRYFLGTLIIADLTYSLIFLLGHCYRELFILLALQIPSNALVYRLSYKRNSKFKALLIFLQNSLFFIFASLLGEQALIQLLFLSVFLCHILYLRPRRWIEWTAVALGPLLWNILEWQNYQIFPITRTQPEWVISLIRVTVLNSSFVFLFVIFDVLRLRYLEIQNALVAAGSNLKQAKDTIERQQEALIQNSKMQAIGEMAGGIAHEINNPLSIIRAQLYALKMKQQKDALTPGAIMESIQGMEQSSGRISLIIQSLLEIAGNGSRDPFKAVSVLAILEHVEVLCQQKFKHHGVELDIDKHIPQQLLIAVPEAQIAQVLLNLLSNAFDAALEAPEHWVRVRTVHDAERVVFTVSDSGPGLTPQQKERLFQPFASSKPIGKGVGLGLSISKGIVEQHQGHLWLDSSANFTTFKVELPLAL